MESSNNDGGSPCEGTVKSQENEPGGSSRTKKPRRNLNAWLSLSSSNYIKNGFKHKKGTEDKQINSNTHMQIRINDND